MTSLVSFLEHYHVNKSRYRLQCHVNKSSYRLEQTRVYRVKHGSGCYHVNKSWHHVNKAWAPACNVVNIGGRSCTTSSVISAMKRQRLKKIFFTVKCDLQQNKTYVNWNICVKAGTNRDLIRISHGLGSKRAKTYNFEDFKGDMSCLDSPSYVFWNLQL